MNILRLREVLKGKMTGDELAEKIGKSRTTISNWSQGINFPKPENLIQIAKILDVDVRELFVSTKENHELNEKLDEIIKFINEQKEK